MQSLVVRRPEYHLTFGNRNQHRLKDIGHLLSINHLYLYANEAQHLTI
jgi:hypothetical protein